MKSSRTSAAVGVIGVGLLAVSCGGVVGLEPGAAEAQATVKIGDQGSRVRAVYDYLMRFGYFENPELRTRDASWIPVMAETPRSPEIFDDTMARAVSAFQRLSGLPVTGAVDGATLARMRTPRCGTPDVDRSRLDPSDKFAIDYLSWPTTSITYVFDAANPSVPQDQVEAAVRAAFNVWETVTTLTFTPGDANAMIHFGWDSDAPGDDLPDDVLARTNRFGINASYVKNTVHFNRTLNWMIPPSTLSPTFQSVAAHEIGHAIGLDHSDNGAAIMYQYNDSQQALVPEDVVAGTLKASSWPAAGGVLMRDLTISPEGIGYGVGNDSSLYQWNDAVGNWSFVSTPGAVADVAAGFGGEIWIALTSGSIYRTFNANFASWTPMPLAARKIATGGGVVWMLGTDNLGDDGSTLYRWSESAGRWDPIATAAFLAVGPDGNPWILDGFNFIYRFDGTAFTWVQGQRAVDIAISPDGFVWIVDTDVFTTGGNIVKLWDQQGDTGGAPPKAEWVTPKTQHGAFRIAAGPLGRPWVIDYTQHAFRQSRD